MKVLAIIFFILISLTSYRDNDYEYLVVALEGHAEVLRAGSNSYEVLLPEDYLWEDDNFRLSKDSELALLHRSGRAQNYSKAGKYKVGEINKKMPKELNTNIQSLALYYIAQSSTCPKLRNRNGYDQQIFPSVESGLLRHKSDRLAKVIRKSPYYQITPNKEIELSWICDKENKSFKIELMDRFGKLIKSINLDTTKLTFSLNGDSLNLEENYLVKITPLNKRYNMPAEFGFRFATSSTMRKIEADANQLKAIMGKDEYLAYLLLASFWERERYLGMAREQYRRAIHLDKSEISKNHLDCFLKRNDFE